MVRLILDFDGTLVDIEDCWIDLYNGIISIMKNKGCNLEDKEIFLIVEDEMIKRRINFFDKKFPHEEIVSEVCRRCSVDFSNEVMSEYENKRKEFLTLIPNLRKGMRNIIRSGSHDIMIVSDNPKDFICRVLRSNNVFVEGILTYDDIAGKDKRILFKNALKKDETNLIIGDRLDIDIKPGNELKEEFPSVKILTVWYPYHVKRLKWYKILADSKPQNDLEKPDFIINDDTIVDFLNGVK